MDNIQDYEFNVEGMHCAACELLIERKLSEVQDIKNVDADLTKGKVKIKSYNHSREKLLEEINNALNSEGYFFEKKKESFDIFNLVYALPIALAFILIYVLIQKSGILNSFSINNSNYLSIFIIGVLASLSTCMAVVGGLVLSISSFYAKEEKIKSYGSQVWFHIGRLISFFLLGGLLGLVGSFIQISFEVRVMLEILVLIFMFILALDLLSISKVFSKLQLRIPKQVSYFFLKAEKIDKNILPFILGIITFFLPCGFTQVVQLQALTTGNFLGGGLTMLVFALGTLPALALISFSSIRLSKSNFSDKFYPIAGIIVLFFCLINLLGILSTIGFIPAIFSF